MTVEGASAGTRYNIIGNAHGKRGEEKPQNIMPVKPEDDGVRDASEGSRARNPDDVTNAINQSG
jgi:hypothetical protein